MSTTGLLGADLKLNEGLWQISRIYTFESWNPTLKAPLDQPGLKVKEGHYVLAINGIELSEENHEKLAGLMQKMKPGNTFQYTLDRRGKAKEISLALAEMPEEVMTAMIGKHMLDHATVEVASSK